MREYNLTLSAQAGEKDRDRFNDYLSSSSCLGLFLSNHMTITLPSLTELPPSMAQRARWARQTILDHPELAEVDEYELLAWVYHPEDEVWYSIAGNYSHSSPEQKRLKRLELDAKAIESAKQAEARLLDQEYWSRVRQSILKRDNHTCQLCGAFKPTKLHIHHILKRVEHGSDFADNLITVCPPCHRQADTKLYNPEWERENK